MSKRSAQTQRKMKLARREKKAMAALLPARIPKIKYVGPLSRPARQNRKWSTTEFELHEALKGIL